MLTRWEPFPELTTADRMFRGLFAPVWPLWTNGSSAVATYSLPVDVSETDEGYTVRATLPGFKPEQVEVSVTDGMLSIEAKRSEEKTEEKGRYLRREVFSGNYRRQLTLPGEVKPEDVKASFEDGVLTVRVPRAPRPQPVKVAITAGS
jgi:HSP20 family protein